MGKYRITQGQNIYDVALHIYGSVEGILDLLATNENLSLDSDLHSGDELNYTESYLINKEVSAYYDTHGITPASGEMHVYPKGFTLPKCVEVYTSNTEISVGFSCSGSGIIEVDWGDNSKAEAITLNDTVQNITHIFDSSISEKRKVILYIQASFKTLDVSDLRPLAMYILKPLSVERFKVSDVVLPLDSLPMLRGTFRMTLDSARTENLMPLVELKELMELNLLTFVYRQPTIDAYLIGLVQKYGNRRNCRVTMKTIPSGNYTEPERDENNRYILTSGMEAIWVLTNEPAWNEGGAWEFIIDNTTYKYGTNN